jgi:signal transduction histidine kinase
MPTGSSKAEWPTLYREAGMTGAMTALAREVDAAVDLVRDRREDVLLLIERLRALASDASDRSALLYASILSTLLELFADQPCSLEECLALERAFAQAGDLMGQQLALTCEAGLHRIQGNAELAYAVVSDRLAPLLTSAGATCTRVLALNMCGVVALENDLIDEGVIYFYRALDDALALGLKARAIHIRANIGELFYISGNIEEGDAILREAHAAVTQTGLCWETTFVSTLLALCKLALDRPLEARAVLAPLLAEPIESLGLLGTNLVFFCSTAAYTLAECGELESAERYCSQAHQLVGRLAERQLRPYAWWARGHLRHRQGRLDAALADLATALAESSGSGYGFMPMRATREIAEIEAERGAWAAAYAAQQRYIGLFERLQGQASRTRLQVLQMRAALREAEDQSRREKELGELKNRFLGMASHEFRTPLTAIQSATEVLRHYHDRLPAEERAQIIADIDRAAVRLRATMEQVLVLTRAEAGHVALKLTPLRLGPWCTQVAHDAHAAYPSRAVARITLDPPTLADAAPLLDADLMQQALGNLLTNAYKYSPAATEIALSLRKEGEQLFLSVQDHGMGIPEADQARLFESFHRAGNVGHVQGTGLGLAIVKRAAEAHAGQVSVVSREGEGSTFTLVVPWRT